MGGAATDPADNALLHWMGLSQLCLLQMRGGVFGALCRESPTVSVALLTATFLAGVKCVFINSLRMPLRIYAGAGSFQRMLHACGLFFRLVFCTLAQAPSSACSAHAASS